MRAVLATNVVVSRSLTPRGVPAAIIAAARRGAFEMLVSGEILDEYDRVHRAGHVRARHGLTDDEITAFIDDLRNFTTLVTIDERIQAVAAHPADDKFIECAVAGGADYVVSGDDDLLALREYRGIRVVTPRLFLSLLPLG